MLNENPAALPSRISGEVQESWKPSFHQLKSVLFTAVATTRWMFPWEMWEWLTTVVCSAHHGWFSQPPWVNGLSWTAGRIMHFLCGIWRGIKVDKWTTTKKWTTHFTEFFSKKAAQQKLHHMVVYSITIHETYPSEKDRWAFACKV